MPSEVKTNAVEQLMHLLEGAKSVYLTDFTGMPVEMMAGLRRRCRESEVEYKVVKDSLTKIAAERAGLNAVVDHLEGPTGLAIGRSDELAPARILIEFAREHKLPRIKGALVEGRMFTEEGVRALAMLPSREILLGQLLGRLTAPVGGLHGVLRQMLWKLTATLQAVADSRKEEGATPTEPGGGDAAAAVESAAVGGERAPEADSKDAGVADAEGLGPEAGEAQAGPAGDGDTTPSKEGGGKGSDATDEGKVEKASPDEGA